MPKLFVVDRTGASVAALTDARSRFDEGNVKAFGASLDTASHAPQNQIAGINSLVWAEIGEDVLRAALWGASPSYARGIMLDSLGGLLDIRRGQPSRTRVSATLVGAQGTTIPAGSLARTEAGDQFSLVNDVTLGADGGTGTFVAVEPGPVQCGTGDLNGIVNVISGWNGVRNDEQGLVGRLEESDASYRTNILARTAQSSIGSVGALRSALTTAGASVARVVENPTAAPVASGGVTLPAHSIFVIADGGLADDLSRAVENHRGMGVVAYAAILGRPTTLATIQTITSGSMRYNGTTLGGFNFASDSLASVASKVGAASPQLSVRAQGDRLLAFHAVTSDTEGFSDPGANAAVSDGVTDDFRVIGAEYWSSSSITSVRLRFSDAIANVDNGALAPEITYDLNGTPTTHNMASSTQAWAGANTTWWTLGTAIPAGVTNAKIALKNTIRNRAQDVATRDVEIDLTEETAGSTDAPAAPQVFGYPSTTTSARVWGWAFGSVSQWQYRRYENGAYLDNDWVSISGSNSQRLGSGLSGRSVGGFTAGLRGSRIDLRAVNSTNGNSSTASVTFDTTSSAPSVTAAEIDERAITLTLDRRAIDTNLTSNTSHWSVSSGGAITAQRSRGRKVYLQTTSPVSAGASVTLSYSSPSQSNRRIRTDQGVRMASFSGRALTNRTIAGSPGAPQPTLLFRAGTGYRIDWTENSDGGLPIDRYEYATSPDNGATWGSWASAGTSTSITIPDADVPTLARVRGSTPNSRVAEILGLSGLQASSFMRPVEKALDIDLTLAASSSLAADDIVLIRNTLIQQVTGYEIGSTLRVANLQGAIELLSGVDVQSMAVTSGGSAVDGVTQDSYVRWTLVRDGITISFA